MNQLSQWEATIKFHIMNLLNVNCKKKNYEGQNNW